MPDRPRSAARAPTRRLPADAETALLANLQAAERPRGLRRPIALWQGLAAGIAGLALGLAGPAWSQATKSDPPPVVIAVESDWFSPEPRERTDLNISNWSPLVGLGGT